MIEKIQQVEDNWQKPWITIAANTRNFFCLLYTSKNAMVTRGYDQAVQAVRGTIADILKGKNAGEAVRADHPVWYMPVSYTHLDVYKRQVFRRACSLMEWFHGIRL